MATKKKAPVLFPPRSVPEAAIAGIHISITNQLGQRFRYHAQTVSLRMKKSVMQVGANDRGCFVWFDDCDLEFRKASRTILFHLKAGGASSRRGDELVILAELVPSAGKLRERRHRTLRSFSGEKAKTKRIVRSSHA
jgi:hypothetical protein